MREEGMRERGKREKGRWCRASGGGATPEVELDGTDVVAGRKEAAKSG
jgi:hypothetical protein